VVPGVTKPVIEIRGGRGRASRGALQELWWFRELLAVFAARAVKVKYKQAAVGIGWAFLQPLLSAAVFALFLGRLADVSSEGAPYFLFALAGMVAWTYFSTAMGMSMNSLVDDQVLLRKVYFPREVLPLASVSAALVDFAAGLVILGVVAGLYGMLPAVSWFLLPIPILILVLAATGVGIAFSAVNVYYRDVRYALPFFLQLGLFVSPVVYSLEVIPDPWRTVYTIGNPVAAAIDAIRRIVVHHSVPDLLTTAGALAWAALLVVASYTLFKRLERSFADRV
jgi:lipopolysaccharide transport system permease protein